MRATVDGALMYARRHKKKYGLPLGEYTFLSHLALGDLFGFGQVRGFLARSTDERRNRFRCVAQGLV